MIRSMYTDNPNHEPSLLMMNSGNMQPIRPSLGSWLTFGLGTENQNLPGFVVLCPGQAGRRPAIVEQQLPAGHLPGHAHPQQRQSTRTGSSATSPTATCPAPPARAARPAPVAEPRAPRSARPRRGARGPDRVAGDGLPHAVRGARGVRPRPANRRRPRALYGDGEFADACLIARRLVERGVRVVQVYYGDGQPWDDHADINQPPRPRPKERPADRRAAHGPESPRPARRHAGHLGRRVRPDAVLRRGQGPRPPQPGLLDVAGRRRRQGRASSTARPTNWACRRSRTACTSTTCTPRSCT